MIPSRILQTRGSVEIPFLHDEDVLAGAFRDESSVVEEYRFIKSVLCSLNPSEDRIDVVS